MPLQTKSFIHNKNTYDVVANSDDQQFIVYVRRGGKQVTGNYTVSHINEIDRRMQNGDSLLDHLMEVAEEDVKRGYWPDA